jgi:hypothetical protein
VAERVLAGFSLPWLLMPRILYPFHVNLYRRRFSGGGQDEQD